MHAKRDYLVKVVFPKLRERLDAYQYHLEDIDLRWGVTADQADNDMAKNKRPKQTCFNSVLGGLHHKYVRVAA